MKIGFGKAEADWLRKIDVYWLNKHGYFKGFRRGGIEWTGGNGKASIGIYAETLTDTPHIRLQYSQTNNLTGSKKEFDYRVGLTTTPCHYGGVRWWFICPLSSCGRRVGTLYKDGNLFGCRHCYDLTYISRKVNSNGSLSGAFKIIMIDDAIEKLERQITRKSYAGKPTKKQKKLYKLYAKASRVYNESEIEKLL